MKNIELTQGKITRVDDEDYYQLNKSKWFAHFDGYHWYAARNIRKNGKRTTIYMHREILGITDPKTHTDHADGDTLNNQRYNIRKATSAENNRNRGKNKNNTTGYKGVSFHKRVMQFVAGIYTGGKRVHLGYFSTAKDAAKAYDDAAKEKHNDFAHLNFP